MSSMAVLAIIIITVLLVSLFMGSPVSMALGFTGLVVMLIFMEPSHLTRFGATAFSQGTSTNQMIAPLFIIMAEFLAQGGVAADIYDFLNKVMKRFRGGLALSTTLACTVFAALCGSSPATAASIGRISISQMTKRGYAPSFAVGTVAAGGTLGIMIPPSLTFVLYGIITETSIAKLLMAGLLPGLMLSALFCISIIVRVRLNPALAGIGVDVPDDALQQAIDATRKKPQIGDDAFELSWREGIVNAVPALILIVVVLGAMYTGITTPTEAAGLGAVGAFLIVVLKRKLTLKFLKDAFQGTARTTAMLLFMTIMGLVLSYVVSYLGIAQRLAKVIVGTGLNPWIVMVLLFVLWFVLGCLMDPGSMVILTIPFIYPALLEMGFDPIWIGVVSTLCVEIGMITPPVGLNLFILRGVSDVKMSDIIKGALPYVVVLIIGLVILCVFPQISLFLPSRM